MAALPERIASANLLASNCCRSCSRAAAGVGAWLNEFVTTSKIIAVQPDFRSINKFLILCKTAARTTRKHDIALVVSYRLARPAAISWQLFSRRIELMASHEYYLRLFKYDHWANRECLTVLGASNPALPKAIRLIAHTLSAQNSRLEPLVGQPQTNAVWPEATINDCEALAEKMSFAWTNYLSAGPGMDFEIKYPNNKGEPWSSRVEDVLIHV